MADEVDRPYAGQEGEINDKLLLDLAWERQQKKVRRLCVVACSCGHGAHGIRAQTGYANSCYSLFSRGAVLLRVSRLVVQRLRLRRASELASSRARLAAVVAATHEPISPTNYAHTPANQRRDIIGRNLAQLRVR